jgi:hypothetical protein
MQMDPIYREIQNQFEGEYRPFLDVLANLQNLLDRAEEKGREHCSPGDSNTPILYFLLRQVIEGFNSILILCSCGFSNVALVLLRSCYEHCVTLKFLQMSLDAKIDPGDDVIDSFKDYVYVAKRKQFQKLRESYDDLLNEEDFAHVEENYLNVKEKFLITPCEKCLTPRVNHRWSKRDIISMAKAVDLDKHLTYFCYTEALSFAHPSADSILKRVEEDDQTWTYKFESPLHERRALMYTHLMAILAAEAVLEHSGDEECQDLLQTASDDWNSCWNKAIGSD